ncbi:hypothetical protein GCM10011609_86880 [Lentzea pudingi]|uniref:Uncharacterized protein n=1 Tax=Lentzea pudingi TaxID=1789439 RepID=A0ABQ2IWW1_9PSEU|nr:hypothetical protein GCM10011609_86880 [Lentzea pudingi]
MNVVGDVGELGGHWLSVPHEQLDTAERRELGEAAVRAAHEEDPAAFGVNVAGVCEQGELRGISARSNAQGRDAQLGQDRSKRIGLSYVGQGVRGDGMMDIARGVQQGLQSGAKRTRSQSRAAEILQVQQQDSIVGVHDRPALWTAHLALLITSASLVVTPGRRGILP